MPSIYPWDERLPNGVPATNVGWRGWEDEDAGGPPVDATPEERESTRLMNERAEQMKKRPSLDDEEFEPGLGRKIAATLAAAGKTYVDMGRRTHVPDEPAAKLQQKLLHPGFDEATRRWESEGVALDSRIQAAQTREQAEAEARDADLRARKTGADIDAARARQRAEEARQAGYQREPAPPGPYAVSGALVDSTGKVLYQAPEQPIRQTGDPVANAYLNSDDQETRKRAEEILNMKYRDRTQQTGPKPQDYVRLEQWKIGALNKIEAAKKKAIDELREELQDPTLGTAEAQTRVKEIEAQAEKQAQALKEDYEKQQLILRGPGALPWQVPEPIW